MMNTAVDKKNFLISLTYEGEKEAVLKMKSANEIFAMLQYADCYDDCHINYVLWCLDGAYIPCHLYGKWHDSENPQKMVIMADSGYPVFTAWGTEH